MSLLLEETHKECREGNMSVRDEMKKLTGTFFNHQQVSVQEAIYRATKMPLTYSSRGFLFVPSHSNSCKFLKPDNVLKDMDPDDENIYMSNLADKYFDRPNEPEFDICMADFASEYEILSINKNVKNPKTPIKRLQTLNFAIKKRCNRKAIIRYPYFNRETDSENYYENLLSLYLPIRNRNELEKPYELFYQIGEIFDNQQQSIRKVKDIVYENQRKYEANMKETGEAESLFNELSLNMKDNEWAEIVANKEKNNLWSREIEQEDNPDFSAIHKTKNKNSFVEMKQTFSTINEIRPLLESMNHEEQEIFYYVREWCINRLHNSDVEPLRLFITGGAGTGKIHLLKCLHYEATRIFSRKKHLVPDENIDEIHTLITAFTGAAAVNVGGVTIHSAFGIGTQSNRINDHLSSDKLNSYRCKLHSLKLLFVDEVSLIQASLWGAMHSRLTQIMGIHSNTAIFGNVAIIAIGDFYQCSPVAATGIYSSLLWSDHFEYIELKINERQKTNLSFSQMLNRIRKLKKKEILTNEDRDMLEKCHQRYLTKEYHPEALHLFPKNVQVDAHNEQMIEKVCTNIRTFYETDNKNKEIKQNESKSIKKTNKQLRLAKNARVMIIKNICVNDGLANGVTGRIVDYVENNEPQVSHIKIKCDSTKVGRLHRISCPNCHGQDTICVIRESDTIDQQDADFRSKRGVKQFPLRLSWAMTIHKAQGITVDQVAISTKDMFGTGMGYTALSRVRTLEGLFLVDLHVNKFYCNENIDRVLSQMKQIKRKQLIFQKSSNYLNILFHNIEGLKCNFNALKNHYLTQHADLICLTETWLNDKIKKTNFEMNGYHLIHKSRSSSFSNNHKLHCQKRGGIALYYRDNISVEEIHSSEDLNLEHITVELLQQKIMVINCYRSPQQSKTEFLTNLTKHLTEIGIEKHIFLIGDLNENSLSDKSKPIETTLKKLGFINIFKDLPTTNSLTSLDCLYCNFTLSQDHHKGIGATYYSFHDTLRFSINDECQINNSNEEIEYNHVENMEVDDTLPSPLPIVNIPKKSYKRKNKSNDDTSNKILKKTTISTTTVRNNTAIQEKQINFLTNIIDITKNNIVENLSSTLTLTEQLSIIGLKTVKILGDGNCFFRAISHQLHRHERDHKVIRSQAIKYLTENKSEFSQFIDQTYATIDNYIKQMTKHGTYADHIAITATAVIINKNIIIHELHKKPILVPGSDFIDSQLHICYYPNKLHYDSVLCIDNNLAFLPFQDLLNTY
ncbi:unnamed protein product [Rotaria socialis]|nr:unnamed protein product [Rotaria socialis]CAF4490249.1 unnamed protein product [Rotaria socialis]